jgi:hypothetical protein
VTLVAYILIQLAFVAAYAVAILGIEGRALRLILLGFGTVASTGATIALFGVGHYWSAPSFVGKLAAVAGAASCPFLGVLLGVYAMRNGAVSTMARGAAAVGVGVIGAAVGPLVGLGLACGLTGDCL